LNPEGLNKKRGSKVENEGREGKGQEGRGGKKKEEGRPTLKRIYERAKHHGAH